MSENAILPWVPGSSDSTSLKLLPGLPFDQYQGIFNALNKLEGAVQWYVGDALNYGEDEYGEEYSQVIDDTGYSKKSLANLQWVSKAVDPSLRRETLSFSHHAVVASLDDTDQKVALDYAEEHNLTVSQLKKFIKGTEEKDPKDYRCPACTYWGVIEDFKPVEGDVKQ